MPASSVRTRFAPSPTGFMHVGNLRTALYSYLLAKKHGGVFVLRIEDTDQERYVPGAVDLICRTLHDTGLHYDEGPDVGGPYGPYVQSQRREIYREHARMLIEQGQAYYCFCDKARLDQVREQCRLAKIDPKYDGFCRSLTPQQVEENIKSGMPFVIRQKMPTSGATIVEDTVFGTIRIDHAQLDDQILMKSDGLPTYNFANVVDDHLMKITHIVRGNEFLISTPKYNLLYEAFGWEIPTYIHVPPVMKTSTQKLSKRLGDASYEDFIAKGYLKEAIVNYIALLGWNPGDDREIFSLGELVEAFEVKGINNSPAIFDEAKLSWLSGEYIRKLSPEAFHALALPFLQAAVTRKDLDFVKLSHLLQPRVEKLTDIVAHVDFIDAVPEYSLDLYSHKKMKSTPEESLRLLRLVLPVLEGVEPWEELQIREAVSALIAGQGIKAGQLLWPLRVALSGKESTPGGGIELGYLIGKGETLRRIGKALELVTAHLAP
jgi:glutamyl-tRNA synthetase